MKRIVLLASTLIVIAPAAEGAVPAGSIGDGDFTLVYDCTNGLVSLDGPPMESYTTFVLEIVDSPTGQAPPATLLFDPTRVFWYPCQMFDLCRTTKLFRLDPSGATMTVGTTIGAVLPSGISEQVLLDHILIDGTPLGGGRINMTADLYSTCRAPAPDAGVPDAGELPIDAGQVMDGGTPIDAGDDPVDAGDDPVDAGDEPEPADAGTVIDAGEEPDPVDAGSVIDAGDVETNLEQPQPATDDAPTVIPDTGCACNEAGESSAAGSLLLLGLCAGLMARRQRRHVR